MSTKCYNFHVDFSRQNSCVDKDATADQTANSWILTANHLAIEVEQAGETDRRKVDRIEDDDGENHEANRIVIPNLKRIPFLFHSCLDLHAEDGFSKSKAGGPKQQTNKRCDAAGAVPSLCP